MDEALKSLSRAIREKRAILFAGAGVSMSVGLPSWQKLIDHMLAELEMEDGTDDWPQSSYQTLAEYYRVRKGSIAPLAEWLAEAWQVSDDAIRASEVHRLIVDLGFRTIYTTNYDHNLEAAFRLADRPHARIVSPADMAGTAPDETQIIKFHGDLDAPESLVLTESDYFDRLSFTSPLDMKFRADVLSHTVLFVGYSLSDMNIRLLLHRLWQSWLDARQEEHRPPSFVFMPRPRPVEEAVLSRWGVRMITGEGRDAQEALTGFLRRLAGACGVSRGGT